MRKKLKKIVDGEEKMHHPLTTTTAKLRNIPILKFFSISTIPALMTTSKTFSILNHPTSPLPLRNELN